MKLRILAFLAVFLITAPAHAEKRYVVRASSKAVEKAAAKHGLRIVRQADADGAVLALLADPASRPEEQVVGAVEKEPGLAGIEPDADVVIPETSAPILDQSTVAILDGGSTTLFYGSTVPVAYTGQPAASIIGLPQARALATGGGTVAIIDTGVDHLNPVLAGSVDPGYDFLLDRPGYASERADLDQSTVAILDGASDGVPGGNVVRVNQSTVAILDQSTVGILDKLGPAFGHGTMVAGLVHLVAPTARIMPLRVFPASGNGKVYDVLRAIYYAVDNGAKVINMSFSVKAPSKEFRAAISYANSRRVICIASAGNSGAETLVYPAAWQKVEGIGSTDNQDQRSVFSNYGDDLVTLAAPGESLFTSFFGTGDNYALVSGTSFSTALVSGTAALLVQINPKINQAQAAGALSEAKPVPLLGAGRLDVFRACSYAQRH